MEPIAYRPRRLGHVNIFVSNLWQSMDFYKSICGMDENARETSSGSGFMSNGNTHHDIGVCEIARFSEYLKARKVSKIPEHMDRPGLYHFGWEMASERVLVEAYKRALATGLNPRVTDAATGRSNYLMDPDGFSHQFYVDTRSDWREVYIGGETKLHSNPPWDPLAVPPADQQNYIESPLISRNELSPIHQQRVTHGTMIVKDFNASARFYTNICGFDLVHQTKDGKAAQFASDASKCVITICESGEAPRMHHVSFLLDPNDDPKTTVSELEELKIDVIDFRRELHKYAIFIKDPDGIVLEFYQPRDGTIHLKDLTMSDDLLWAL